MDENCSYNIIIQDLSKSLGVEKLDLSLKIKKYLNELGFKKFRLDKVKIDR